MARRRLAAWDDFRLIIVRPVVEADSKPGAACLAIGLATARLGVVVHSGRPQVGVLQIMLRPVGDESALRVRPAGRPKKRALSKTSRLVRVGQKELGNKTERRRRDKANIP